MKDKYINLFTDFGFKKLFGEEDSKEQLIAFLNTLLPARHHIKELTYTHNEKLGATPVDRKAIFDLHCVSTSGERFIVELQKAKQNFFKERSIYYATFPIQEQAEKGDWDFKLEAVYTIAILDQAYTSGVQQGISQGISQGINRGKALLLAQMIAMRFPHADLSHYQSAISNAAEDDLARYSARLFSAKEIQDIFEKD